MYIGAWKKNDNEVISLKENMEVYVGLEGGKKYIKL